MPVCAALASLPPEPRRHAPPCTVQVSGPSVLRAHSVAILKYNASHPRTDVHVDDGVLAMTLALSPRANYSGGGTCPAPPHPPLGTLFLARFLARLLGRTMSRGLELRPRAAPRP